jgi:hypothetical protein
MNGHIRPIFECPILPAVGSGHHFSGYSCVLAVYLELMRLPAFTQDPEIKFRWRTKAVLSILDDVIGQD